jgi:O-antigen/teichoic acid export membrane protein
MLLLQMLTFLSTQADLWIAGAYCPAAEVPLYGAAQRLTIALSLPLVMANQSVVARIAALHALGRKAELERVSRTGAALAAIPTLAALGVLLCWPRGVLGAAFGDHYAAAAVPAAILALGQLVNVWSGTCGLTLAMTGHHRAALAVNVVAALALFGVGPLAARAEGMVGLAIVSAAVLAGRNLALVLLARRLIGVWTHVPISFSSWFPGVGSR